MFRTYQSRLMAYTILLMAFLTGTLGYIYHYSRSIILGESENSLTDTARMLNGNLELEEIGLLHYTEIVRDDIRMQEYVFMVSRIGTDNSPLTALYDRQYGWLPVSKHIIISNTGKILLGKQHTQLAKSLMGHLESSKTQIFYIKGEHGVEMVSWAPLTYQKNRLGVLAHTLTLDDAWLEQHRQYSGGILFLEYAGTILLSSLPETKGKPFNVQDNALLNINNDTYRIRPVLLSGQSRSTPRLWYGVSEKNLLAKLDHQTGLMLTLVLLGCLAVLLMGIMIVRNFSRPLTELMRITRSVAAGNLPVMSKSAAKNEVALLSNQFAEMLSALRNKQEEIDRVHKELEESAITDSLTRLHNRRYLQDVFPGLLGQTQRESMTLTGIMMDIDNFKLINDRYGHQAGDECLKHFSEMMQEISRANDYVFRIGGEEFLLLSLNDNKDGGKIQAEKIRATLEQNPAHYKDTLIPMTTSIGISQCDLSLSADESLTHLLFNADKALYQAKAAGRNQVRIYVVADKHSRSIWDYVS